MLRKILIILMAVHLIDAPTHESANIKAKDDAIFFDGASVQVGIESLDLTSEWVDREAFYDGYMTEEIEYRKEKYPGSYLAVRYCDNGIIRVYFSADDFDKAVPISVYGLSWGVSKNDIINILGDPLEDITQTDIQTLLYEDYSKSIKISFMLNKSGLYAVDIYKI